MQWESINDLSFIRPTFELQLSDFSSSCIGIYISELCPAVESHLRLNEDLPGLRIDFQKLDLTHRIQSVSDYALIPLLNDFTIWDIRAAENDEEEELYPLVAAKLSEYSTETIILATLEDMFTEMNDYMQKNTFLELEHHFASFSFKGMPISARVESMNVEHPLNFSKGLVLEPEIERGA
jgi:hypothetical protein